MDGPPRGRIANDAGFGMPELANRRVESIVAFCGDGGGLNSVEIVAFCFEGSPHWHRFFLDAGIGFWEEWTKADTEGDFGDCEKIDVAQLFGLEGATLLESSCEGSRDSAALSRVQWRFSSGVLTSSYRDERDCESETVVQFTETDGA